LQDQSDGSLQCCNALQLRDHASGASIKGAMQRKVIELRCENDKGHFDIRRTDAFQGIQSTLAQKKDLTDYGIRRVGSSKLLQFVAASEDGFDFEVPFESQSEPLCNDEMIVGYSNRRLGYRCFHFPDTRGHDSVSRT
jgi:hypothetical protein